MTSLIPRVRPIGEGADPGALERRGVPDALRRILSWSNGVQIEQNVVPKADDVGLDRILPVEAMEDVDGGLVFAEGDFETRYMIDAKGVVHILWGPEDRDRRGTNGRTRVGPSVDAVLRDLILLEPDPGFEGQPSLQELVTAAPAEADAADVSEPPALSGPSGPDVRGLDRARAAYFARLPTWLQQLLEARNGGRVSGVPLGMGESEEEELVELFGVAPHPNIGIVEASSLHDGWEEDGLRPNLFPVGRTLINGLLFTDADTGQLFLLPDESEITAEAMLPLPDGGAHVIRALSQAAAAAS
jgi:hypothetical protein